MEQKAADTRIKVLLIYFSFSSQTKNLLQALEEGLKDNNIEVVQEKLEPINELRFPIGSIPETLKMMLLTFFRKRIPIRPLSLFCFNHYDLIILAGPTWSYNPSGPVLSLLDRDGKKVLYGKKVLPLISCRGYWRVHWWGLRHFLLKYGAELTNLIVFSHPNPEPWRTIGVFLKLAGRIPEKNYWISKYYNKYGHTREQLDEARKFGQQIGKAITEGRSIQSLVFKTKIAIP